jgi:hypothetical protein
MLTDFPWWDKDKPNTWRFYGFSNEPGAAAAIILLFLVNENFNIRKNKFLTFLGVLTFSTSFYGIFFIYFLYYNWRSFYKLILPLIFIGGSTLIMHEENIIFDYLKVKIFYIFFEDFNYELRIDSSFFYLFELNLMLGLIYFISIFLLPKKFWLFFLAMGFYRFHFIFNFIPLIISIIYTYRFRATWLSNLNLKARIG